MGALWVRVLMIFLLLSSVVITLGATIYTVKNLEMRGVKVKKQGIDISAEIKELTKRELQLSIEVKELQKRKLNCEFKTERCPNG